MRALFLDRDGVINYEKKETYIFKPEELIFYPGVLKALSLLSQRFDYLIIVTNQRGIGRGLMSVKDLDQIHDYLLDSVKKAGGRIDAIYYAPESETDHPHRKPNPGMAFEALKSFPDIDFTQSIMVGNNLSDMQFGKAVGMKTVFLFTTHPPVELPHPLVDVQFESLIAWTEKEGSS